MTSRQLKNLGAVTIGWFGLALICAKIVGLFTDNAFWRGTPYLIALAACVVYLLSLYPLGRQTRRSKEA